MTKYEVGFAVCEPSGCRGSVPKYGMSSLKMEITAQDAQAAQEMVKAMYEHGTTTVIINSVILKS